MSLTNEVGFEDASNLILDGKLVVIIGKGSATTAHTLLEDLLNALLGVRFDYDELARNFRGKPYLEQHPVHFNISHTKDSFVLGICLDREIGLDMESDIPGKDMRTLADYAFSPDERQLLDDCFNEGTFLKLWTMKEAYLKATGIGLMDNLPSLHVVSGPEMNLIDEFYSCFQHTGPESETISIVCKGKIPSTVFIQTMDGILLQSN